jgi:hypothetical protein
VISFLVVLLLIAACVAFGVQVARWRAERQVVDYDLPPLVIPLTAGAEWQSDAPSARQSFDSRFARPDVQHIEQTLARVDAGDVAVVERPAVQPLAVPHDEWTDAPAHTVRFRRPADEAVQLLPGRLEVLAGDSAQQEIRFVRVPGEQPQLILGREPGPAPQHVTLHSSTVSRRHARLSYSDGRWTVVNLSQTNPVVVNDEALPAGASGRPLADGDRIELGEVVLRFCAH